MAAAGGVPWGVAAVTGRRVRGCGVRGAGGGGGGGGAWGAQWAVGVGVWGSWRFGCTYEATQINSRKNLS